MVEFSFLKETSGSFNHATATQVEKDSLVRDEKGIAASKEIKEEREKQSFVGPRQPGGHFIYPPDLGFEANKDQGFEYIQLTQTQRTITKVGEQEFPSFHTAFYLPMPNAITFPMDQAWVNTSMGTFVAGKEKTAEGLISGNLTEAAAGLFGIGGAGIDSIKRKITEAGISLTGVNAQSFLEKSQRRKLNPHLEVLYDGPQFRSFNFQWEFAPKSHDESQKLVELIKELKYGAAPSFKGTGGKNFMQYPGGWEINFKHQGGDNTYLPRIGSCVCTAINVDYGGKAGVWAAFRDGAPSDVILKMGFTETQLVTREGIGGKGL